MLLDFGVFKELKDISYFKRVKAWDGTVVWPHEQDICPDPLYLDSAKKPNKALNADVCKLVPVSPDLQLIKYETNSTKPPYCIKGKISWSFG